MEYELDSSMGFDKLGLYYEVHTEGLDGENFYYSIYFENELTDEKFNEVQKAVCEFFAPYDEKDIYTGYIDITKGDNKAEIYLDLGNVEPQYENTAINGILQAVNKVSGIKSVIVNEGCDCDFF